MADKPLNARERAFCREYLVSRNAKDAATKAGYAAGSAHVQGHRLLQRPAVKAEIARLEEKAKREAGIVDGMITDAKRAADPSEPAVNLEVQRLRREREAEIAATTTRAYLLAAAIENLEIALGRRKRRIVKFKKIPAKGQHPAREETLEVEIFDPNPTAANQAITILLKEIGGQTEPENPEQAANPDVSPALLDALATFRTSRPDDPAK